MKLVICQVQMKGQTDFFSMITKDQLRLRNMILN